MAINFPNSPKDGDIWTDASNQIRYQYRLSDNSWFVLFDGSGPPGPVGPPGPIGPQGPRGVPGTGSGTVTRIGAVSGSRGGIEVRNSPITTSGDLIIDLQIDSLPVL